MARSQSIQFAWFERSTDARAALDRMDTSGDTYGDRVALTRRLVRVASRAEIAANEQYLNSLGYHGPWRAFRHDAR